MLFSADSDRRAWKIGTTLLVAVEAARLLPEASPGRTVAAAIWIGISLAVLLGLTLASLQPLRGGRGDVGWYALALLVPPVLVLWDSAGYVHAAINLEAINEVGEGLKRLASRRDLGLFDTAYLGYPARQYLLAALPSCWGGRHLLTLRLGFGLPYLVGYGAFVAGTARYLTARSAVRPRLLASCAGLLVALGSFPLLYARLFEQTLLPLALMLLFLGSLMFYLAHRRAVAALAMLWALGFMPYAYTPALAGWMLGMLVLLYLLRGASPPERTHYGWALGYAGLTFLALLICQPPGGALFQSLRVGRYLPQGGAGFADASTSAWVFRLATGLHGAVGIEEALLPAPLTIGVVMILVHSVRRRDWRLAGLVAWAAATVMLALVLQGYWQRVPQFDLHRAMLILPPLSLAVVLYAAAFPGDFQLRTNALVVQGVIVFMLLNAVALPWLRRAPSDYYPFAITDIEEATMLVLSRPDPHPVAVYVEPPLTFPLELTLAYFRPATRVLHGPAPVGEHRAGTYVLTYVVDAAFVPEDPTANGEDYPIRYRQGRPYLSIRPE